MTIDGLIGSIKQDSSSVEYWKLIGDALRNDDVRNSEVIRDSTSEMKSLASANFSEPNPKENHESLILEILRVFVNLLADSDTNRKAVTDEESHIFWRSVLELFELHNGNISERVVILLNQFINNTELKNQYLAFFFEIEIEKYIMNYLQTATSSISDLDMTFEFLSEYFNENLKLILNDERYISVSVKYIDLLLKALYQAIREVDNDDLDSFDELILNLSNILLSLTSFEDLPGIMSINPNLRCLFIIQALTMNLENGVTIKRKLLATSGNLTSMKTFDSKKDLEVLIDYFKDPNLDPYLLSSSAIAIGNYVTSRETLDELKGIVSNRISFEVFINNLFSIKFNDIIQFQAIHMLNNILGPDISAYVAHQKGLLSMAKSVIENANYYKEVYAIFHKFMKKLIKYEFIQNKADIMPLIDLWDYMQSLNSPIDKEEIYLLLLQAYIQRLNIDDTSFLKTLAQNMVSIDMLSSEIPFTFLAEKLKTMGIFNQKILTLNVDIDEFGQTIFGSREEYEKEYLSPLLEFFIIIKTTLSNNDKRSPDIIWNNSRFVAASTLRVLRKSTLAVAQEIAEIAITIISQENGTNE